MANKYRVDELYDLDGVKSQLQEVEQLALASVQKLVKEVNQTFKGVMITLPDIGKADSIKAHTEAVKAATDAGKKHNETTKENIQFQKELEKTARENTKRLLDYEKQRQREAKETAAAEARGRAEVKKDIEAYIKSVKAGQKELDKLAKEYEKTAKANLAAANKAEESTERKRNIELRKAELQAAREYAAGVKQLKKDTDELAKSHLKEAKELERSRSAYTRLSDAHIKLKQIAKDVGAELGVESEEFKKASAEANKLGDRLKAIDGNLGVHGRNVGNYASQWNGLSYSMTNIISELPNAAQSPEIFFRSISNNFTPIAQNIQQINRENKILIAQGQPVVSVWKQIGAAIFSWQTALIVGVTLLTAYGKDITDWLFKTGDGAIKASDGTKVLTKESKILSEVYKEAATTYAKTAAELDILKTRFFDSAATAKTKQEVIKTLNEKYEDTIGKIHDINEAEEFFINRSDAFVKSLMLRAQIEGAYQQIAENTTTLLKQQATTVEDNVNIVQKYTNYLVAFSKSKNLNQKQIDKEFAKQQEMAAQRNTSNVTSAVDRSNNIIKGFILSTSKELEELNKQFNFGSGKKEPKEEQAKAPTDLANTEISAAERVNKAKAELNKVAIEDEKNKAQAIIDNEKSQLQERLNGVSRYLNAELALNDIARDTELKNVQESLKKIAEIEGKTGKRTPQEIKLLEQKEAFEAEKGAITARYAIKENDIIAAATKKNLELVKQNVDEELKYRIEAIEKIATQVEYQYGQELSALSEQLVNREITISEFEKRRKVLENKAAQERLDLTIAYLQEEIAAMSAAGLDIAALQDRLDKLQADRLKTQVDGVKAAEEAKRAEYEKTIGYIRQSLSILDDLNGLSKASTENKIEQIGREKEAEQKRYEDEVTLIENSTLTKEQREDAIRKAQAKTREQQAKFERQEIEAKRRQAVQDKALAIFKATIDIASAIIKSLGNPIQTAIVSATGAAQLATIIAAPIPQYEKVRITTPEV